MQPTYAQLSRLLKKGERLALVSSASLRTSAPGEGNTRMLVTEKGQILGSLGGGQIEAEVARKARSAISTGKPQRLLIRVSPEEEKKRGMLPGGTLKFLIEPLTEIPHLFIFGAGALSRHLAAFALTLGFRVTVVDEVTAFLDPRFFPGIELRKIPRFRNLAERLHLESSSYAVIATRNHDYDENVLEQLAHHRVRYLGLVHGRKKVEPMFARLREKGLTTKVLQKVFAPAGLGIKAFTMEEMALLIMAEITKIRRENL